MRYYQAAQAKSVAEELNGQEEEDWKYIPKALPESKKGYWVIEVYDQDNELMGCL